AQTYCGPAHCKKPRRSTVSKTLPAQSGKCARYLPGTWRETSVVPCLRPLVHELEFHLGRLRIIRNKGMYRFRARRRGFNLFQRMKSSITRLHRRFRLLNAPAGTIDERHEIRLKRSDLSRKD